MFYQCTLDSVSDQCVPSHVKTKPPDRDEKLKRGVIRAMTRVLRETMRTVHSSDKNPLNSIQSEVNLCTYPFAMDSEKSFEIVL
jgi:hypothetical protein